MNKLQLSAPLVELIDRLNTAVASGGTSEITHKVKLELQSICERTAAALPADFQRPGDDCYARRLLHRNGDLGYTIVVMTWGPGQQTPLHDHAGMWCVECVVQGQLHVTQYDLQEQRGDNQFRFQQQNTVRAGVGDAGCLIPPFEYHVLSNPQRRDCSITIHVYGGEMDHCHAYRPVDDHGWYTQQFRRLSYSN